MKHEIRTLEINLFNVYRFIYWSKIKYNRKRIQELEQRLQMKPMYEDDDCHLSSGISQTPKEFSGKMVKIPTDKEKVLELYPGKDSNEVDNGL